MRDVGRGAHASRFTIPRKGALTLNLTTIPMSFADTLKQKLTGQAPVDKYVLWVVILMSAMGAVAVYSAITYLAEVRAGTEPEQ